MDIKLPFGVRDGKVIHISEIPLQSKGLKCQCLCPECGQPLIARKGDIKIHHFAHSNVNCVNALESALHSFAKEVLQKHKKLRLPELKLHYSTDFDCLEDFDRNLRYYSDIYRDEIEVREIVKERETSFDRVESETMLDDIKPDIIVYKKDVPLLIEIAVTHFIDKVKESKIKSLGVSTIEIDLNEDEIDFYNFDREKIEKLIIESTNNKFWIYNRKAEEGKLKILEENKKIAEQEEVNRKLREKREERRKISEKKKLESKTQRVKKMLEASNVEKKLKSFENAIAIDKNWIEVSNALGVRLNTLPEFLNIKGDGELAINCDRRIWQSMIYRKFIFRRYDKEIAVVNVINWIKQFSNLSINYDLSYTDDIKEVNAAGLTDAVFEYFRVLEKYKILQTVKYSNKYYAKFRVRYGNLIEIKDLTRDEIIDKITKLEEKKRHDRFWGEDKKNNQLNPYVSYNKALLEEVTVTKEQTKEVKKEVLHPMWGHSSYAQAIADIYSKLGTCSICGKATDDWTSYDNSNNTCKCRECSNIK